MRTRERVLLGKFCLSGATQTSSHKRVVGLCLVSQDVCLGLGASLQFSNPDVCTFVGLCALHVDGPCVRSDVGKKKKKKKKLNSFNVNEIDIF